MRILVSRFLRDESGATAIEYGLIAAGIAVALLASLLYWQHRRRAMVVDCLELGGSWDGGCRLPPNRILIRPDLGRG